MARTPSGAGEIPRLHDPRSLLMLQRLVGNQAVSRVVQRFGESEHQDIASKSPFGGQRLDIDLGGGEMLRYEDMVTLAGDWFGSLEEMEKLATTADGRATLRWTKWKALGTGPEPPLSEDGKKAVNDRFYRLAAKNISHFSGGGTARESYRDYHRRALFDAVLAGGYDNDDEFWRHALTEEAFGNHFLTDSFSAGHVRTPRQEIKEWYAKAFPDSVDQFVDYMVDWLYSELIRLRFHVSHGDIDGTSEIPITQGEWGVKHGLNDRISDMAGAALESFSLGDLVSGGYHDFDNKGLFVVSDVDPTGAVVPGGYPWRAMGDGHLAESPDTQNMAAGAMKATEAEIVQAREQGYLNRAEYQRMPWYERYKIAELEAGAFGPPYAAERFLPRADTTGKNQELQWRWGSLNEAMATAIGDKIRREIVPTLESAAPSKPEIVRGVGAWFAGVNNVHLHIDVAMKNFAALLGSDGVGVIERAVKRKAR